MLNKLEKLEDELDFEHMFILDLLILLKFPFNITSSPVGIIVYGALFNGASKRLTICY